MDNLFTVFDNNEKAVLNKIALNESKESVLNKLSFDATITTDDEIITLIDGIKSKVDSCSSGEWDSLQLLLPFELPYDDADATYDEEELLSVLSAPQPLE